jgi:hypothetical protein
MGFSFVGSIGWRLDQTKSWPTVELRLATDVAGPDFVSASSKTHFLDGLVLPVEARHFYTNTSTSRRTPVALQTTVPGTVVLKVAPSLVGGEGGGWRPTHPAFELKLLSPTPHSRGNYIYIFIYNGKHAVA